MDRLRKLVVKLRVEVEFILIDDGSTDGSLRMLLDLARDDNRVRVLGLARNFGHQAAVTAGLDCAAGDAIVVMDGDLQDPPELVEDMLHSYREGYDVVYAQRIGRPGESLFKRATAWAFYRLMRLLVHKDLPPDTGDFRIVSRNCLLALQAMRETHRFLRGMFAWVGYPQTAVKFVRPPRAAGITKYPLSKMLRFAWNAVISFSPAPLRFSFGVGFSLVLIAVGYVVVSLVRIAAGSFRVSGWTSSIVVTCLVGGAVMINIGFLGEYVSRIFEEAKGRPLYVVRLTANLENPPVTSCPRAIFPPCTVPVPSGGRSSHET